MAADKDIAVLVSGGVDSSVALALLSREGFRLQAYYLKIWLEDRSAFLGQCPWGEDLEYARAVCGKFNVPLETVPLQKEYYERVVDYTVKELRAGRTPSPDVLCNRHIKFGAFADFIPRASGPIASGHYARTRTVGGRTLLACSPDPVKDQTYFLSRMTGEQVFRARFPIGRYTKAEVRALADEFDLPNKARKDSQGICFLGKVRFRDFVAFHLGTRTGDIIEKTSGRKLGHHDGYWFHTIGQRQGLGLSGGPWYVVGKDIDRNAVFVSGTMEDGERRRSGFRVGDLNWIGGEAPEKSVLDAKIRHGARRLACTIAAAGKDGFDVVLAEPETGVAPGQFCVFYDGDICLGSGVIE